jgi:hypothetical protein
VRPTASPGGEVDHGRSIGRGGPEPEVCLASVLGDADLVTFGSGLLAKEIEGDDHQQDVAYNGSVSD